MDAQFEEVWNGLTTIMEKHIMMPEQMCVCSICSAKCVREFGATPNFVTADGVKMPKYNNVYCDYIYCENCDWKLSQLLMRNKRTWATVAHEFSEHDVRMWARHNCTDDLVEVRKRLRKNETARLWRLREKREMEKYKKAVEEGRI